MEINTYYQKGRYKTKDITEREKILGQRSILFQKVLPEKTYKTILDAGCGDGMLGSILKKQWHSDVYGTDISRKGISIAKRLGVKGKIGDLSKKIPFQTRKFDLVIASEIIEHVSNPDQFLKEIHRVLKNNGFLLLTTPNLSSWINRILFLFGIYPLFLEASTEKKVGFGWMKKFLYGNQLVGHIHVFNYYAIFELLTEHGFQVEKIVGRPVNFITPKSRFITIFYTIFDTLFASFPKLCSNMIVIAKKR